jgi:hypothetical protein
MSRLATERLFASRMGSLLGRGCDYVLLCCLCQKDEALVSN